MFISSAQCVRTEAHLRSSLLQNKVRSRRETLPAPAVPGTFSHRADPPVRCHAAPGVPSQGEALGGRLRCVRTLVHSGFNGFLLLRLGGQIDFCGLA